MKNQAATGAKKAAANDKEIGNGKAVRHLTVRCWLPVTTSTNAVFFVRMFSSLSAEGPGA